MTVLSRHTSSKDSVVMRGDSRGFWAGVRAALSGNEKKNPTPFEIPDSFYAKHNKINIKKPRDHRQDGKIGHEAVMAAPTVMHAGQSPVMPMLELLASLVGTGGELIKGLMQAGAAGSSVMQMAPSQRSALEGGKPLVDVAQILGEEAVGHAIFAEKNPSKGRGNKHSAQGIKYNARNPYEARRAAMVAAAQKAQRGIAPRDGVSGFVIPMPVLNIKRDPVSADLRILPWMGGQQSRKRAPLVIEAMVVRSGARPSARHHQNNPLPVSRGRHEFVNPYAARRAAMVEAAAVRWKAKRSAFDGRDR